MRIGLNLPQTRRITTNGKTVRKCRSAAAWRPRPVLAGQPHDAARRGHEPGHRASLWPRRASAAAVEPFLVPVLWRRHGHGLAFLGNHHERDRRVEARAYTPRR